MSHRWATIVTLALTLVLVGVFGFILIPLVIQQLDEFIDRLPTWLEQAKNQIQNLDQLPITQYLPVDISQLTVELANQIEQFLETLPRQIVTATIETVNSAVNLLLTIVLTIFFLFSGRSLWAGMMSWLPSAWKVRESIHQSFQGYFSGQATISAIQSAVLMTTFLVLQIPFGLLFGLMIGIASFIPLGGGFTVTIISLLLASQNFWLGLKVLIPALILGQINETVIAPRLMGGLTGLNPAIVFLSLLIGAKFGGLLGLVLVVPMANLTKRLAESVQRREHSSTDNVLL
ncbi:permease [Leptolyngbya sp. NIES-2104]|nr:permease [Leptolyngbya sp. NIES-2104]